MKLLLGYENDKELIRVVKLLDAIISDGSYKLSDVQVFRAETNVVVEEEASEVVLPPIKQEDVPLAPPPVVQEEMKKSLFKRKK